ncbi:EpsG family protein [Chryseobacterium muglaense]|nr:EpsG family protein [Chryseobacterium muglaense]
MEILLFIFILHLLGGLLIENLHSRYLANICNILLLVIIFILSLGVTRMADWEMYRWFFKLENDQTDFVFYRLSVLFNDVHLGFTELFQFHIIVTTLINYFLITRFSKNYFYVMLAFMVLNYVHSVNQIRYFLGFPILCLGFYYLFLNKKIVFSIGLFILACLCHSALSVLLIFIPLYYFIQKKFFLNLILVCSVLIIVIIFIIFRFNLAGKLNHFGDYLVEENLTSLVGGLYRAFPYILNLGFLYFLNKSILEIFPEYDDDPKYVFLYKICFFSILFIPISFVIDILGHRYVIPFHIFWCLYFLYLTKDLEHKNRTIKFLMFGAIQIISAMFFYIFPDYVLKNNHYLNEMETMITSIKYLKNIL